MQVIGIIGGMGPEATALLFQRIVAATPAQDDADHIPLLIDNDPRIPSRIKFLIEGHGEDPTDYLCNIAQRLEKSGCAALAMPCNTAHHFAAALQDHVHIPLLNMVAETSKALAQKGYKNIGMFTSPALRIMQVYEPSFAEHGLKSIFPDQDEDTLGIIRAIKAGQQPNPSAMKKVLDELKAKGAEVILAGCSELSLFSDNLPTDLPCVDSINILRDSVIDFATNG